MPTYEYICSGCGFEFEKFQSIASEPITICPRCDKPHVKRIISGGTGLIFKGSGFYITDYKNKSTSPTKPKPLTKDENNKSKSS